MSEVYTLHGVKVLVDLQDVDLVSRFEWCTQVGKSGLLYAVKSHRGTTVYMHRLIAGPRDGEEVDHANGDGLDNRRINLRVASHSQNMANRGKPRFRRGTTSRYKGVYWDVARSKWKACIGGKGNAQNLGGFPTEEDAAMAYDRAALARWGEFARLNFDVDRSGSELARLC